ncbi:hypothetical protein C8R30_1308 [Nitrosomonas nitrosa]|uniref:Uncharacterized protein n=1 Tax=Nitrosomonas nitrosa TaxID=52442 RepID=A0A1I4UGU2_9PROT|nr:hypothetical protein C8R30_1308 [Nitrosomonas nitrosa]SFM88145.1 hypothetical protein SAMN05421880_1458 [Nitrosomonas nitrosa]
MLFTTWKERGILFAIAVVTCLIEIITGVDVFLWLFK